ncbi:hypothetical protein [Bdellovibrio sp. HCB2-146]|uniref:hypothetical protein n=1 Tax=Bdellovibrio sp. HCB2-146 TaxID=3394362 RepID=UPI0039BD77CB
MQAAKRFFPFFIFIVAVCAGYFTRPVSGSTDQSSLYDISIQNWDQIACLSKEENLKLYQTLHLKANVNPSDCESKIDGRFNKVIAFLVKNQLNIHGDAFGDLTDLLRDPITFISENVPELDFDLNQDKSIAYNAMQRAVYLGGDFFRMDPYVSVAILLHEAWHSVKIDPGHERCTTGDIAQTKGGCDQTFSLAGNMIGGYSVTFAYLAAHGLYNKSLPKEKRKILVEESLVLLSSRFNTGVQSYASVVEGLVVLNKDRDIELVHPLLNVKKTLVQHSEKFAPKRLAYNQSNGGVFIFTEDMKLYEWDKFRPIQRYYADIFKEDQKIIDSTRLYLAVDDYAYTSVLLDDNVIYKVESGSGNDWALEPALRPTETALQISTYHLYSAGFLDQNGDVYRIMQHGRGRGKPYMRDESISRAGVRFRYITGGVNTDSFWGVTDRGEVYYMIANELLQLTGLPNEPIVKIQVTHLGVYVLSEQGHLYHLPKSEVGRGVFQQIPMLDDVQDFAVTKNLVPQGNKFDELPETTTGCTGKPIAADPYFPHYYWSLDQGRLFFGDNKSCTWVADEVTNFFFQHAPTQDFSEFRAILKQGNRARELRMWAPFPFR